MSKFVRKLTVSKNDRNVVTQEQSERGYALVNATEVDGGKVELTFRKKKPDIADGIVCSVLSGLLLGFLQPAFSQELKEPITAAPKKPGVIAKSFHAIKTGTGYCYRKCHGDWVVGKLAAGYHHVDNTVLIPTSRWAEKHEGLINLLDVGSSAATNALLGVFRSR